MTTLHRSDFTPICDLFTELDLLPTYERCPYNIYDGCSMLTGDTYFSGHLVSSHFGLAYVLLVETNPFPEFVVIFSGLFISNIPRYFLDIAYDNFSRSYEIVSQLEKIWELSSNILKMDNINLEF